MDNDVFGTDYCIGFSTAVTRGVDFIHALRTCAGSHERIAIIELFGRYCGETSLIAAYLAGVDRAIISEVPFDPKKLADLIMKDKRDNPKNYASQETGRSHYERQTGQSQELCHDHDF
jgi:6-phosphofructokinase 1